MTVSDRLRLLLVTAGGAGLLPRAPGTWGSLVAVAAVATLHTAGHPGHAWPFGIAVAAAVLLLVHGRWLQRHFRDGDPGPVVLDEVAGQCLALLVPLRISEPMVAYPLAFLLFRFFDVFKPLGVRRLERLPGAWGILMDDLLAGAYAALVLVVVGVLWP